MQLLYSALGPNERQWVRAEVDLVVERDAQARVKGAQGPREPRGGDLVVDEVEGAADGDEEEDATGPFGGAAEGACGLRGAEA